MPSTLRSTRALLAAFAALGGFLSLSTAQSVATTPVGAMTYSLPATTAVTNSQISVPLISSAIFSGPVASLDATSITVSGTPFTAGSLAVAGSPYFLRIASGAQAGRMMLVTANTNNQITVDTTDKSTQTTDLNLSGYAVAAGDKIELIVGDTIASFFGDGTVGNPLILVGNTGNLTADGISIFNKATSKNDVYYFNTTSGFWRSSVAANTANQNNVVLYPEAAIGLTRRSGRAASSFTVLGEVPKLAPKFKVTSGKSIFTMAGFPANTTLGQLNLANWTKANSNLSADTLSIYNPVTSKGDVYYQRLDNSQWRKVGDTVTDQSGLVLPAGGAFTLLKRGTVLGATSYISAQLPYTL